MLHTPERYAYGLYRSPGWKGRAEGFYEWLMLFTRAYFWEHQEAAVAARRIHIRDRGLGQLGSGCVYQHSHFAFKQQRTRPAEFCRALIRLGKERDGNVVLWCWRCEEILADSSSSDTPEVDALLPWES